MSDPYQVLGVSRSATAEQITAAYRALAQEVHPDKGGSTERMAIINGAYQLLTDPERRAHADRVLAALDPELDPIKRLVAGKSLPEIRCVIEDTRAHIRSFSQRDAFGNYGGPLNAPRLARHRKELRYLEGLLA